MKPSTEGKVAPTGEANLQANKSASTEVRTLQSQSAIAQRKIPLKPFAATVVRDWYNKNLKMEDKETYNTINGCFRVVQSNDLKATNHWFAQLEQIIIRQRQQLQAQSIQLRGTKNLIATLCQHSHTIKSEDLNKREELFSRSSENQQTLRRIFQSLATADLLSI